MTTWNVIFTPKAVQIGAVYVRIHGMVNHRDASIALGFSGTDICGLTAGFHGSTEEIRQFAAELIRHADLTDQAAGGKA